MSSVAIHELQGGARLSPFGLFAPPLLRAGYSPVPIEPGAKRPLGALGDWSRLRVKPLSESEIASIADEHPGAGLGVAGGYGGLIPIDIDAEDEEVLAAIQSVTGPPLVAKRGRRGLTIFGRDPTGTIGATKLKTADGTMLVEVLATGQTVIPPTIHPETGAAYVWETDYTLADVSIDELPELPPDLNERLTTALRPWLPVPREYAKGVNGAARPVSPSRMQSYARAALDAEANALRGMAKGGRNRALFDAGCKLGRYLHHKIMSKDEIDGALLDACRANGLVAEDGLRQCEASLVCGLRKAEGDDLPVLEDRPPRASQESASAKGEGKGRESKGTQADVLLGIALGENVELFHTPDGTAYADVVVSGHRETWPVKSVAFRRWLRRTYYKATTGAPNNDAMSVAMGIIEARAHFDGQRRDVHLRVATVDGRIYLDLCDDEWRAIEIEDGAWRVIDRPPIRFRRTPGMLPLPLPDRGGQLDELRKFLRVEDDDYVLVVSWLLAVLRGKGPYPILALTGEQGTGKSVTAAHLRGLVDPSTAPLRTLPRDTRDLYIAAINGHVLVFDNLSGMSADVSDALCRLSTGGGFATRALYTNDDEVLFDGQRPMAMTSITDVASRSDLADRLLIVRLDPIPDNERQPEAELLAAFEAARPRILGALLDVVAHGLLQLPHTRLNRYPRMADYALWIRACETAIWSAGMHMAAYEANRGDAVELVLEADPVAVALLRHMEARSEHTTTAAGLLEDLGGLVGDSVRRSRQWPQSARGLSGQLTRLAPALRRVGVTIESDRQGHTGRRLLHIRKGVV